MESNLVTKVTQVLPIYRWSYKGCGDAVVVQTMPDLLTWF